MCLATTKKETEEFRKKNKDKESIWCYKVYKRFTRSNNRNVLRSIFYDTGCSIKPGVIKSNRSRLNFDKRDRDYCIATVRAINSCLGWSISKGIYVYQYKRDAERHCNLDEKVVRIKCLMSEFVAYNSWDNIAVFRTVYLPEEEYNKAIE